MAKDNLQNEDGHPLYSYKGLNEIQKKGILEEAKNRGFTISSQYHEDSKTYDIYFKEKEPRQGARCLQSYKDNGTWKDWGTIC